MFTKRKVLPVLLTILASFGIFYTKIANAQPPIISNLELRFDATDIDGTNNSSLTDGGLVSAWIDLSGNIRNMAEGSNQPIYRATNANFNNKSTVEFDGLNDKLVGTSTTAVLANYPITWFYVAGVDSTDAARNTEDDAVISLGSSTSNFRMLDAGIKYSGGTAWAQAGVRPGAYVYTTGARQDIFDGNAHVITVRMVSPTQREIYVDGKFEVSGTANANYDFGANTVNRWSIGAHADGTPDRWFKGQVGEVLVYSADVAEFDRINVENYLSLKWRNIAITPQPDGSGSATFPNQTTGFTFPDTTLATLSNDGLATLTVTALTVNKGSFATDQLSFDSTAALTYPIVLFPGASVQFDVSWHPDNVVGVRDATIDATSDNPEALAVSISTEVTPALTSDLVVYYDFEETTGNVFVDKSASTNINSASVIGRTIDLATEAGVVGSSAYRSTLGAADFVSIDGTADGVLDQSLPTDMQFGDQATGTDFTLAFWVNRAGGTGYMMGSYDLSGDRSASNGMPIFTSWMRIYGTGGANFGVNETFPLLPAGQWTHFAISADRDGDVSTYINGQLDGQRDWGLETGDIADATVAFLLGRPNSPSGIPGTDGVEVAFDDFAVWHRALGFSCGRPDT